MKEPMTPSRVLEEYDIVGRRIPKSLINEMRERFVNFEEKEVHPWKVLCGAIGSRSDDQKIKNDRKWVVQACAEVLLDGSHLNTADGLTWHKRIESLEQPKEFIQLFAILGIPGEKWRSGLWMRNIARELPKKGGISRPLAGLSFAIDRRFGKHPNFVAWMDGKKGPELNWVEKIESCSTPSDFLKLFTDLNIPGEEWRSSEWLQKQSQKPIVDGGVGQKLNGLYRAIFKRFASWSKFIAWIDGKEEPDIGWIERVNQCRTPEEMLFLFSEVGISGDNWRKSNCFRGTASLPPKEGGIGLSLYGLRRALLKRFETHRKFLIWMDGEEEASKPIVDKVRACGNQDDFLVLFNALGIPEAKWRTSVWLSRVAKLPKEEGGIGRNLAGLYVAISADDRFETFKHFVAWMDGKAEPEKAIAEKMRACETPDDFLRLFDSAKVPEEKWRMMNWMRRKAKLSPEEGGVSRNLSAFVVAIQNDDRFEGSYAKFVAWMDGKNAPEPTVKDRVNACQTSQELLSLFKELGIPDNKWRSSAWLRATAKLSAQEGGIGKSMSGVSDAVYNRFGSHKKFVAWMDGKKEAGQTMLERERSCSSRKEFLSLFSDLGIPKDSWRRSHWFRRIAPLSPKQGGIGRTLSGLARAFETDPRFHSFRHFLACMDDCLPFEGIRSTEEAHDILRKEILRFRESGNWIQAPTKGNRITKAEYDEIARPEYYKKNPVVRAVADYLRQQQREARAVQEQKPRKHR